MTENLPLQIAKCDNCGKEYCFFSIYQTQRMAEEHMMKTGHIVSIHEEY